MRRAALLALALAIAACTSEDSTRPTGAFAEADSADMQMLDFRYNVTRNGIRRSLLQADTAYFYDARQMSALRHVRATFFNDDGASRATLTADRMEYNLRDGSMRAEGNVVLVGPADERLTTSVLVFDVNKNTLSSDQPFVLMRAGERMQGDGFDADADFSRFEAARLHGVTADTTLSR